MSRVKVRDDEKLSDNNIASVIRLLEAEKPITKKEACAILNISYNVSRLGTIIENYKNKQETKKRLRAEKAKKPVTDDEIGVIIKEYLEGQSVSCISDTLFRPVDKIKEILKALKLPLDLHEQDSWPMISEDLLQESFNSGEVVFSCKYKCLVKIRTLVQDHEIWGPVYAITMNEMNAYQPAFELMSLKRFEQYGVKF